MKKIYFTLIYGFAKKMYKTVLRKEVIKAIDNPDTEWDNVMMNVLDSILK